MSEAGSERRLALRCAARARAWLRGRLRHPARAAISNPEDVHRNFTDGSVLIVGDSHTWMAGAGKQYPLWDTDCRGGRNTAEGVEVVLANLAPHRVVVLDLATIDDGASAEAHWADLLRVREAIRSRQLVLVSNWRLDTSLAHVRDNQRRLSREDPTRTSMVDWGEFVQRHPRLFAYDSVHFTEEALGIRTGMVWSAVRAAELRDTSTVAARGGAGPR